jgi:hypothetical protein
MKAIILAIVLFATGAYAGDWNKTYEYGVLTYSDNVWIPLEKGNTGQYLIKIEENLFKWVDPIPPEELTITDVNYVKRICFDDYRAVAIEGGYGRDKKRCVDVKWLHEFLRMMNP